MSFGVYYFSYPDMISFSFWELAIPLLVLVIPIFLISDIKRLWHYMQKKREAQRVSRVRSSVIL